MSPNSYLTDVFNESGSPVLFIDFDGTISKRDVIDEILKEFADKSWLEIEKQWTSGKIGSRECLQKQFALVEATPAVLNKFIDTLELDEGFPALLRFCRDSEIDVHIVSDGFDYYIRRMLERSASDLIQQCGVSVWANRLIPQGKKSWRTEFPFFEKECNHGCATCKPQVMRTNNPFGSPSVFIGDGLSDRYAAQQADVVFAKKKLSEFCLDNRIPQTAYSGLLQVAEIMDQAFESFVSNLYRNRGWKTAA